MRFGNTDIAIFDIDGVLANCDARIERLNVGRYLEDGTVPNPDYMPDWELFHSDMHTDPVNAGWAAVLRSMYDAGVGVVLLTNRPEQYRLQTIDWIEANKLPYDELRMRDGQHYDHAKQMHLEELIELGYHVLFAVDDDPLHEPVYTTHGVPFVYAHSGYYNHQQRLTAAQDFTPSGSGRSV